MGGGAKPWEEDLSGSVCEAKEAEREVKFFWIKGQGLSA